MPVQFAKPEPHIVHVDGEPVRLHLKRMTVGEFEEFNAVFSAYGSGRMASVPETALAPAEGEQAAEEQAPLSIGAVRAIAADVAADAAAHADWIRGVFERYVSVAAGDVLVGSEVITEGVRFLELMVGMNGQERVVGSALAQLWLEHRLTPSQKKTLQLRRASGTGSTPGPRKATPGEIPASAVTDAVSDGSARAEDVTAPSSVASSGTTGPPRSSASVPSGSSRRKRTTSSPSSSAVMSSAVSGSVA